MAINIDEAFLEFERVYTTLTPEQSKLAVKSTENLIANVNRFNGNQDFIGLKSDLNLTFGSFARETKIPVLDDIDLVIGINGNGCFHSFNDSWNDKKITAKWWPSELCHDGTPYLNSRKVINRFVKKLNQVDDYKKADISRNQQACTLELSSYPWSFDIVPAFRTTPYGVDGKTCYMIPNGKGNWMMTDPRIDQIRINNCVAEHGETALRVIRLVKYWQKNNAMPEMPSYLIEKIAIDYFNTIVPSFPGISQKILPGLLQYLAETIMGPVQDAAEIEPELNHILPEERSQIAQMAGEHANLAFEARMLEMSKEYEACSNVWQQIFGSSFPKHR